MKETINSLVWLVLIVVVFFIFWPAGIALCVVRFVTSSIGRRKRQERQHREMLEVFERNLKANTPTFEQTQEYHRRQLR